ncbi:MAG: LacI family DNA-binding transcriptional regulator [Blautia sp.]|jgi:LacI family transcriptional regulator
MNLTIFDIAKKAGVSKSTVSRVLNHTGYVKEETRKIVEEVIAENHYMPSSIARNLSMKESSTIGVLIQEVGNPFFGELLEGITEVLDQNSYSMFLCDTDNDFEKQSHALEVMKEQRVKGLILNPTNDFRKAEETNALKKQLQSIGTPTVLLDRQLEKAVWDGVYFENYQAAYAATEALIQAGNKTVGTIHGTLYARHGNDRYEGFLQAMEDYQVPVREEYIWDGAFTKKGAYEVTKKAILENRIPDALLLSNNLITMGFLKAISEHGLQVGKDIAVMGIDRIDILDIIKFPLSYVDRDVVGMGRLAAQKLLERIDNPQKPRDITMVPYHLVLNGSEKKC